jgi:cytochrome c biogenesis protein CcdA
VAVKSIASLFVALSGLILFTDKVINLELTNNFGFKDSQTFIWAFTQTISPMILALGAAFRPYRLSYAIPVYFYFIQLYWVFNTQIDDTLLHIYALGCSLGFILLILLVDRFLKRANHARNSKLTFLEKALDLSINLSRKS